MVKENKSEEIYQYLTKYFNENVRRTYTVEYIKNKTEVLYGKMKNLYEMEEKIYFKKWIEKGSNKNFEKLKIFRSILTAEIINKRLFDNFELPIGTIISDNVTNVIINILCDKFKEIEIMSNKKKQQIPFYIKELDRENDDDNQYREFIKTLKTGDIMCDNPSSFQFDEGSMYSEDEILNSCKEVRHLRDIVSNELLNEEDIYNIINKR
uniref:Phage portal protein n=1 Tax=Parastrongyloides trichosuri TaxID=131310 RepID=A0A0N4ZQD9_PARTI